MRLVGVSAAVPRNVVTAEDAAAKLGSEEVSRIVRNSGVRRRRVAPAEITACDLNVAAAQSLLKAIGWSADSVDLLIHVTQTPDHFLPGSAYVAHGKLGAGDGCLTFDMGLGCSGFTHGMVVAHAMLGRGPLRRGLLLCGDTINRVTYAEDKSTSLLFGDAGSAVALEATEDQDQVRAEVWGSEGAGINHLIVPAGGFRRPWDAACLEAHESVDGNRRRPCDLFMDGAQVFNFTLKRVPPMVTDVLARAGWEKDQVDAFVLHQANSFMLDYLRRKIGVPAEKLPVSLSEYGNTSSASIPLTIAAMLRERVAKPARLVLAGFGVGLSWSAVAIETKSVQALPLVEI